MGRFFPEAHERFLAALPPRERDGNLAEAYGRLLACGESTVRDDAARAWCDWEEAVVALSADEPPNPRYADPTFRYRFARTVTHYFANAGFQADDAIVAHLDRVAGIPAVLAHGRLDLAGPADAAWGLARAWPAAQLHVVDGVGHAGSDAMNAVVLTATDRLAGA